MTNGDYTYNWEKLDVTPGAIKKLSTDKSVLYTQEGPYYHLTDTGTYPHVLGHARDDKYMLYISLNSTAQLCYPQGSDKGKRVCRYLGCAEDKLDNQYCWFTWEPK